jgi:hypothetical protein
MVHIDAATLRRHPILGVLIGGGAAVLIGGLVLSGWPEARALLSQKAPRAISLHEVVSLGGVRWVTVTDGRWHCDQRVEMVRSQGPERWILGPVETTEVPVTGAVPGELVVARFDGKVACAERSRRPLTGVVGSKVIFTSQATLRRWRDAGHRVVVLDAGASPRMALIMLIGLLAIAALGAGFAAYYLALLFRSSRERPPAQVPTTAPIH